MDAPEGWSGFLIGLAADSVAPVIGGCVGILLGGPFGAVAGGAAAKVAEKGINFFGPRIAAGWLAWLKTKSVAEQQAAVEQLAALPTEVARREATAAVERAAPEAPPHDKELAIAYLAAIPNAIQRSLVSDRAGRMSCPPQLLSTGPQALMQLLPKDVPPFSVPCDLPQTPYRLEQLLGTGGFGAVYKAAALSLQLLPFAIKFCLDEKMVATLRRERDMLSQLQNAGGGAWSERIVRLYGFDLDYPKPFLVYEFVPGGDLTAFLAAKRQAGGGLSPAQALPIIVQLAEGLAFAHSLGLVHRDLKPANVLITGHKVKLADFGIGEVMATHAVQKSQIGSSAANRLSPAEQSDLFRGSGTLLYMSREQKRGDPADPRHDLYSLGVLWYQLLIGDVTQELHPGWQRELEVGKIPVPHIELIKRCVGLFEERPANGKAMLALLKPLLPSAPGAASRAPLSPLEAMRLVEERERHEREEAERRRREEAAVEKQRRDAEFEKHKAVLAEQISRDAFADARQTVLAMLRLKPNDPEALQSRAFIDKRLQHRGDSHHPAPAALPVVVPVVEEWHRPNKSSARGKVPEDSAHERARAAVRAPAVCMLIAGAAGVVFNIILAVYGFTTDFITSPASRQGTSRPEMSPAVKGAMENGQTPAGGTNDPLPDQETSALTILLCSVCAAAAAVTMVAAVAMLRLKWYWLALTGSVAATFATCICLFGIPISAWSMLVLLKPEVKSAFT